MGALILTIEPITSGAGLSSWQHWFSMNFQCIPKKIFRSLKNQTLDGIHHDASGYMGERVRAFRLEVVSSGDENSTTFF